MADDTGSRFSDPSHRPGRMRPGIFSLLAILTLVLGLNLAMPGGLGAVASVLPKGGSSDTPSTSALQAQVNPSSDQVSTGTDTMTSVADLAAAANPAVVTVYSQVQGSDPFAGSNGSNSQSPMFGGDQSGAQATSIGSGFIIDTDGHVVTNNHVVEGGSQFAVQLYDGTTVEATVVGTDPVQDLAVLKLADGTKIPGTLSFGDSSTLRPGDPVVAIGTPLGEFANSVSTGVIGGTDRTLDDGTGNSIDNLLQHDAPISSGNSGGPLLNSDGKVVGINVATATTGAMSSATASGLNFAIESNAAKTIVQELITTGSVSRPYLGIEGRAVDGGHGVVSVESGSPAAKAGLEQGDIITKIDDQTVDANHSLQSLLYQHKAGDKVTLTIDRSGTTKTIDVTLGERPSDTQ